MRYTHIDMQYIGEFYGDTLHGGMITTTASAWLLLHVLCEN